MKAFIFDMDGVIIDSEPKHSETSIEVMDYFGVSITRAALHRFVGSTNSAMWAALIKEYGMKQTVEEIRAYQLALTLDWIETADLGPIDGISELIDELKRSSVRLALASSSDRRFIDAVVKKFELAGKLDFIISGESVSQSKPAPDIFLAAADNLGVEPEDCVVLEDSKNGVLAAKAAQMRCIGYANPNSGNQDLSGADWIVHSIKDISVSALLAGAAFI